MATKKDSALPAAAALDGTEILAMIQAGANVQAALATMQVPRLSTVTAVAGVLTLDLKGGARRFFKTTLTANVTSVVFTNLPASGFAGEYELHILQDGTGGRTFAMPASHKALGGSDTAINAGANVTTVLSAASVDQGTTWRYAMQESA